MYYGFDIGGTKTEFAVFSKDIKMIEKLRFPTPTEDTRELLDVIGEHVQRFDEKYKIKPEAIGVSIAGSVDGKGSIISANIAAVHGQNLGRILSEELDRKVKVENDVNCFMLSEYKGGCAEGFRSIFGITLGTGVGGSLIIDGNIISGKNGFAAEWGHTEVASLLEHYDLPRYDCGCGLKACLDLYGSGRGLSRIYKCLSQKDTQGKEIIALKDQGDILAQKAYDIMIDLIASHLVYIVNIVNPDIIPVGGGLSKIDPICTDLSQALKPKLISLDHLPIICPSIFSDSGSTRGAALLSV